MRSDEERNKSIGLLMAKVQARGEEVAKLKGTPLAGESSVKPRGILKETSLNRIKKLLS
jgi:hypothetical protein